MRNGGVGTHVAHEGGRRHPGRQESLGRIARQE
jgi:hypothetical protein